ncbi:MAG: TlpA family protein disulfide reductase [Muribaculaceae bacterium]|nr:TlpA family protein disulfide reductase [Muribaculaceae bacterium]
MKMKKFLLSMLVGMMALGAVAQDGKFTVKGSFKGLGDTVRVFLVDANGEMLAQESRAIVDDKFDMTFDLTDAATLHVFGLENGQLSRDNSFSVPALPGEHAVIEGDANACTMSGSQFYVDYQEASNLIEAPQKAARDFVRECREKFESGVPQEEVEKEFDEKYPALEQSVADAVLDYVKAHPDQDASAMLLSDLGSDTKHMEEGAALLSERARGSVAANMYKGMLAAAKKEEADKARQEGLEGNMAPDFTLMDINGKPMALSSLRGKWVILDFWGSWCSWCIKGMPKMKEYYAKYNDKLEILGVDCNDTVEKWKAAVAKHELPWLHVYWDKDDENCDNPIALYGVRGFPTKVIIDPEGNVAKVIVGEAPAFYGILDEMLK